MKALENSDEDSIQNWAREIVFGTELHNKLRPPPSKIIWNYNLLSTFPSSPGRHHLISFSDRQVKFPKKEQFHDNSKKAIAFHSFANHELLAIEMMALALLIYPHDTDDMKLFKKGLIKTIQDEQNHFNLYRSKIIEWGYDFGAWSLNSYFWQQMEKLKTPQQFVAVMSLTFENANLDFAKYYLQVFKDVGDLDSANILQTVYDDEVTHVAFGAFHANQWRKDDSLWNYYRSLLPPPMTPARARGFYFNPDWRKDTRLGEDFIESLSLYDDDFAITKRKK